MVLLALGGTLACAPLDRRAPFRERSFGEGVEKIDAAIAMATSGAGGFVAGFAAIPIDAPPGVPLAGYGDRDGVASEGVRDPAFVRAFVVGAGPYQALLFTADVLLLHSSASEEIRRRLAAEVPRERVFFTASHTHSGPGGSAPGLLFELVFGAYSEAAFEAVVSAHVEAGRRALRDLKPAAIGIGRARVSGIIGNRVDKDGPVDDELFVLRLEQEGGRVGALWSFACHAVLLPPENHRVSADYPAFVAEQLADEERPAVLGFAAGGVGSSNPRYEREEVSWFVEPLARGLRAALMNAQSSSRRSGSIASAAAKLKSPTLRYRVSPETMIWSPLVRSLLPVDEFPFGALTLGNASFLFAPAEVSGAFTRAAKAQARKRGSELAIFPFNGSYYGYVVPRSIYDLEASRRTDMTDYETQVMTFFGPYGGDLVMGLGMRLVEGVRSRAREAGAKL